MFSLSFLALSLFYASNVLSAPSTSDSGGNTTTPSVNASAHVVGPVAQFNVVNRNIAPDGFNRSATLVNGIFPGPLIQAQKGDQFSLRVINELTDPGMPLETSIHWHGLFQHGSNFADGVSYVTQCPIEQEDAFNYQFTAPGQTGTYWYHSHLANQYCDGLRGALVIYDPEDPLAHLYDVDDANTVITISDWYQISSSILGQIDGPIFPNSTLINGKGRYAGGPDVPLAVVHVEEGQRYRFRLVSTACDPSFNFTIDGHRMTIIEADGNEVEPVDVDWLIIYPAQRYSVVVTANQTVGNYWIRALSSDNPTFEGGQNMAILRYGGAPDQDPTSEPGPFELGFSETDLHALINPAAPGVPGIGNADVNLQLDPGFNFNTGLFEFNNVSFVNPPIPVLLQILSGAIHPSQLLPNGSVYELPLNKTIEISFPNPQNAVGGPHPIHLHGHSFSVVRSADSSETNYVNPVRRDVVSIGADSSSNVTIRFATDNPGPWFLHCHIDWHLNHGFAVVMAEAPSVVEQEIKPPQDWFALCPSNQNGQGQQAALTLPHHHKRGGLVPTRRTPRMA